MPSIAELDTPDLLVLRGMAVNAPAAKVASLLEAHRFRPSDRLDGDAAAVEAEALDAYTVALRAKDEMAETFAVFFVQPVDSSRSVIRGVLDSGPKDAGRRLAVLRHHNERLTAIRDRAEREAAAAPSPPPIEPDFARVAPELAEMPQPAASGRKAAISVQVARKWPAAEGIAGFELRPVAGLLPTFQPGAHIDVHLPNGLVRQYSIVNGPGETDRYVIGVKREPDSLGGSSCLHESVREGDVLAISEPRNNFPLRRDATRTILIAGGIGITPLIAMAQALHHSGLVHELHYFAADQRQLAFEERRAGLGDTLVTHLGLGPDVTMERMRALLAEYRHGLHVYLCGPAPMLEAGRSIAAAAGWPDSAVHFEYFKNTHAIDDSSSFDIALARSCVTLNVPGGRTILEVMRENGIDMPSSCEQGACGTCVATVIEGEPLHQDVYLNEEERRAGQKIMTCVSRARSARLVLDI